MDNKTPPQKPVPTGSRKTPRPPVKQAPSPVDAKPVAPVKVEIKPTPAAIDKPKKIHLHEGTATKNRDAAKSKGRVAVYVKKKTLDYELELKRLQIELLKLQNHVKEHDLRVLMIFEGRDAAGKGGTIKRITEHLNPRGARVVALEKPSDVETRQWYFQRYIQHLPAGGEIVLFDRSWYNRAMVEPIMGFCTDEQNKRFIKDVPLFEQMLVKDGIKLFKFYFSVSKEEQLARFKARETDPLKQYKISPVDMEAQNLWDQYSVKKFQMLSETNRTIAPWTIIRSDNKKLARLNTIKYILRKMDYDGKLSKENFKTDSDVLVSGIKELKLMEDLLMTPGDLPG
ncbi:MAG: polyphosphate kinase 2 [Candidatus Marinimicrobia bacterium]|jgi:polyphosphate kinase 2|nr:polyphosphate kinase 2 [Candidatus Neomarinimicrobiota bacterium]MBT3632423.1 polyphosphate kinase 2 [Candidatus Neomarinimicrobiota bacterium]MBT3824852.1 polyphosphate kinase 2 [Candidatus Neomarinimicrobiota bacterium]MBT4132205.1 polyphosphate kinase 2 [Candidatus Neomarinimicrobiota bacterium]MBT4294304.1 polyphosphate kinase 2 [Candidatus Neomarinimicrobiota bacterium]